MLTGNVTFTPEAGFTNDPTPIPYTVSDTTGLVSNEATITIDYVPVATDDSSTGNTTGTPATVDVLANDTTGDTVDPTTVQIVGTTNPGDDLIVAGQGTWTINPTTGAITFTPQAGFTADPTNITYTVDDAESNTSNPAVVSIDYTQQPPVAIDDSSLANPPGPVTLNAIDGTASAGGVADSDPNGDLDPATVSLSGGTDTDGDGDLDQLVVAGEGTWSTDATGNVTFTPEAGFTNDPTPVTYRVSDATNLLSNLATITIDYAPVATDDSSTGNTTGTPATVDVLANDTTGDTVDPTTVQIVGTTNPGDDLIVAGQGTWTINPTTGAITFTPQAGFTADPTNITYTVDDAESNTSNPAVVSVDYVPVATDDSSTGNTTGTPVTVDVLANDTTGDTVDPTTVQIVGTTNPGDDLIVAGQGTWTINPTTGAITFTPQAGFTADPTNITYTVDDAESNTSNPAVVSIDYTQQPPVAIDDSSLANPPGPVTLNAIDGTASAGGVADSDPNGDLDPATVDLDPATPGTQTTLTVAGQGTWSTDATGNVTFTPEAGFTNDPTPIPYTVSDTTGLVSNEATITIDYAPVATDDSSTGNTTGTPATVDVLANDTTGDTVDPTTVQIVGTTNPGDDLIVAGQGTWTINPTTGAITFTPQAGFTADPTNITYTVDDAESNTSNPAVVSVDYVPVATDDSSTGNTTGTPVTVDVLANDTTGDTVDPTTVQIVGTTNPGDDLIVAGQGTWTINPTTGAITFTPQAGFTADPTNITYTVDDAESNTSNPAVVSIDYTQQPPVAIDDSSLANPPGPVTLNAIDGTASAGGVADSDPNGDLDPATVSLSGGTDTDGDGDLDQLVVAGEGTWSTDATGNVTFTPEAGFTNDPTPVTYRVSDATNLLSNLATITIDYAPVATDDSSTGNTTGTPATVDVLANDTTGDTVDPTTVQIVGTTNPGDDLIVAGQGTWTINPTTGAITFTPQAGFTADPTNITYTVDDARATPPTRPSCQSTHPAVPVATDDSSSGQPARPVPGQRIDGPPRPSGSPTPADTVDPATVQIVGYHQPDGDRPRSLPVKAPGRLMRPGMMTFTPEAGFTNDPTRITYTVVDATTQLLEPRHDHDRLCPGRHR